MDALLDGLAQLAAQLDPHGYSILISAAWFGRIGYLVMAGKY
jgi:hypothetical protein